MNHGSRRLDRFCNRCVCMPIPNAQPSVVIDRRSYLIHGQKVPHDADLAGLYDVATKAPQTKLYSATQTSSQRTSCSGLQAKKPRL